MPGALTPGVVTVPGATVGVPGAPAGDGLRHVRQGAFTWWQAPSLPQAVPELACSPRAASWTSGSTVNPRHVDLTPWFNDRVTELFKPGKYLAPRSPYVSLSLPAQGIGAWAGHVNAMAGVDDAGLHVRIDGVEQMLPVDHVVICAGQEPYKPLEPALRAAGVDLHVIGGADVAAELDAKRAIDQGSRLAASF